MCLLSHCPATMWGGRDTQIHRQQGDLISLLLFFQNKESRLMMLVGEGGGVNKAPNWKQDDIHASIRGNLAAIIWKSKQNMYVRVLMNIHKPPAMIARENVTLNLPKKETKHTSHSNDLPWCPTQWAMPSYRITLVVSCVLSQEERNDYPIYVPQVKNQHMYRLVITCSLHKDKLLNQSSVITWEEKHFHKWECCTFGFIHILLCIVSGIYKYIWKWFLQQQKKKYRV
jgi:hypothetical protein